MYFIPVSVARACPSIWMNQKSWLEGIDLHAPVSPPAVRGRQAVVPTEGRTPPDTYRCTTRGVGRGNQDLPGGPSKKIQKRA
jgi:hypothetical protein